MNKLLLVLALTSGFVSAHEVELKYMRINQNLFDKISFPMDALGVGYAYSWKGLGLRLEYAKSTETANSLYVEGKHYSNKINHMYGAQIFYRYKWLEVGVGKTDYKSTWKVNGKKPSWSDGTDSDWAYHARLYYPLEANVDLFVGYSDLYRKHKENKGREETRSFNFGIAYNF